MDLSRCNHRTSVDIAFPAYLDLCDHFVDWIRMHPDPHPRSYTIANVGNKPITVTSEILFQSSQGLEPISQIAANSTKTFNLWMRWGPDNKIEFALFDDFE